MLCLGLIDCGKHANDWRPGLRSPPCWAPGSIRGAAGPTVPDVGPAPRCAARSRSRPPGYGWPTTGAKRDARARQCRTLTLASRPAAGAPCVARVRRPGAPCWCRSGRDTAVMRRCADSRLGCAMTSASAPRIPTSRHTFIVIMSVIDMSVTVLSMPRRRRRHKRRTGHIGICLLRPPAPTGPCLAIPASARPTVRRRSCPPPAGPGAAAAFRAEWRRVPLRPVDDVYCPACRLVLYRRGVGDLAPRHCPRCIARRRRLVTMIALDRYPPADLDAERSGEFLGTPGSRSATDSETQ